MNKFRATIVLYYIMAIGIVSQITISCGRKSNEGDIIFTRTSGKIENSAIPSVDSWKLASRSEIVEIQKGRPDASPMVLTSSFFSARSPEVSNDCRSMIFAGQKNEGDTWQIWETDLRTLKTIQLTKMGSDCTDPSYLPLGRFLFTSHSATDSLKTNESIFTSNTDGTDLKRITYNPVLYRASNVLGDGRILTIGAQTYPETGAEKYMVMRPDGTKSELFYTGQDGSHYIGRGFETNDGKIILIEAAQNNPVRGALISVSYNSPMHSRINLSSETEGDFRAVFPEPSGKFLVSYRKTASERYGIYEFDPQNRSLGQKLYSSNDFDVIEVADIFKRSRARKLPSEVNPLLKTGLIMCQDVNLSDDPLKFRGSPVRKTRIVEIMGVDSSMGVFKPSKDGSFYLKVVADKPFQIITLDENGNIIKKCDWIWLRNNERRGCVGCHEDQNIVPDNRIPLAVKLTPIGIPSHVNKIKDIMIDTE
jgi:hypothetical protein